MCAGEACSRGCFQLKINGEGAYHVVSWLLRATPFHAVNLQGGPNGRKRACSPGKCSHLGQAVMAGCIRRQLGRTDNRNKASKQLVRSSAIRRLVRRGLDIGLASQFVLLLHLRGEVPWDILQAAGIGSIGIGWRLLGRYDQHVDARREFVVADPLHLHFRTTYRFQ
jgi:hypothetical protein